MAVSLAFSACADGPESATAQSSPFGLSGVCTIHSTHGVVVVPGEFVLSDGQMLSDLTLLEEDGAEPSWFSVNLVRPGSIEAGTVDDIALLAGQDIVDPHSTTVRGAGRWLIALTMDGPIDQDRYSRIDRISYRLDDTIVELPVNFEWRVWSGAEEDLPADC